MTAIDYSDRNLSDQALVEALLKAMPYASFLGIRSHLAGQELTLVLPYANHLVGNPMLPALHGGVIGAVMEITALAQLALSERRLDLPKPIDVNIDYLRSGRPKDTFARAEIKKSGRRIANVRVEAWQDSHQTPIAALHAHFLLGDQED